MPRKKTTVKAAVAIPRIRENTRLMHTHESMVDFISGRQRFPSFQDVFSYGMFGLDFFTNTYADLENDIIYSDYEEDDIYPHAAPDRRLQPHPRIRQLSDEEAEKHAKELIEEERRKDKTERNKRKKLRKKEKKRLEKENGVKAILPEEEQAKADSSEDRQENSSIDSNNNAEANEFPESGRTQNETEEDGCDERSGSNTNNKEENNVEQEDEEDSDLSNSYISTSEPMPQATRNQRPARARTKDKPKSVEAKPSEERKPKAAEKPEPNEQDTVQEFLQRSRELAGVGHGLASSGQYEAAVKYYTDAIKYNPKEFRLFGNRSLCYERMEQYENALRDAELALCMEPSWIKGLFRKGKALCGLKRYYEASLIYKEVLLLESSSAEAAQALKRAQTLHLMEMGFSWSQSSEALRTYGSLEEAVESLFGDSNPDPTDACASRASAEPPLVQEEDEDDGEGEWIVQLANRPSRQQKTGYSAFTLNRSKSNSPTPFTKHSVKPELYPVWVGSLAPAVTYTTLHELFSRAGAVYSIKMLLEQQCAFVNYTRKEDSDRAIQCLNGMVMEGAPLSVRYPIKNHAGLDMPKSAITDPSRPSSISKECFFWRTIGCTRPDCTYKHDPNHKSINRDKFTS